MLQSFTKYHQVINPIKFWFNARNASSKSDRNRSATWIGKHKEPLTRQQYERRRYKHRPFVLGRDNVVRRFEPVELSPEALAIRKESVEYDVKRTANGWLPVYTEYRNGRSRISTVIRRIDGNVEVSADLMLIFEY